jgi:hypothetical protein
VKAEQSCLLVTRAKATISNPRERAVPDGLVRLSAITPSQPLWAGALAAVRPGARTARIPQSGRATTLTTKEADVIPVTAAELLSRLDECPDHLPGRGPGRGREAARKLVPQLHQAAAGRG